MGVQQLENLPAKVQVPYFILGSVTKFAVEVDAEVAVGVGDSLEYVCRTET